jgi:hypothetical protein
MPPLFIAASSGNHVAVAWMRKKWEEMGWEDLDPNEEWHGSSPLMICCQNATDSKELKASLT